jgi:thioesterase domain-containing protein
MVPTIYMVLDALPLTPNGKVDRRALPAPDNARPDTGRELIPPRDTIEFKLVQIWEEVLDIRPIGVRDNFFELGGHSLLAVRVMAQIQQQVGKTLTLTHLFQGGTVEYLASLLRREGELDLASSLVGLQTGGSKRPIYFVHPSGGSVHWYANLSSHLGNEQPFYGIQAQGLFNDQPLHTSIEAMAAHYAQAIRTFQPDGPYLIGSWSLGVIIAFELAQQLQAQGQEIALLALLDQGPDLPSGEPEDDAAYLVEVFGKHLTLSLESLRQLDPDAQVAHVFSKARKINWITPDVSLPQFRHFIRILRTHTDAWRAYRPNSYQGKITLFRAETQTDDELPLDMGWQALAKGGVEIIDVPGDHISMLQEPMIKILANKVLVCLEKIEVNLAGQSAH